MKQETKVIVGWCDRTQLDAMQKVMCSRKGAEVDYGDVIREKAMAEGPTRLNRRHEEAAAAAAAAVRSQHTRHSTTRQKKKKETTRLPLSQAAHRDREKGKKEGANSHTVHANTQLADQ